MTPPLLSFEIYCLRSMIRACFEECEGVQAALDELLVRDVELIDELGTLRVGFVNWLILGAIDSTLAHSLG